MFCPKFAATIAMSFMSTFRSLLMSAFGFELVLADLPEICGNLGYVPRVSHACNVIFSVFL